MYSSRRILFCFIRGRDSGRSSGLCRFIISIVGAVSGNKKVITYARNEQQQPIPPQIKTEIFCRYCGKERLILAEFAHFAERAQDPYLPILKNALAVVCGGVNITDTTGNFANFFFRPTLRLFRYLMMA
jgi:hypothetical protein